MEGWRTDQPLRACEEENELETERHCTKQCLSTAHLDKMLHELIPSVQSCKKFEAYGDWAVVSRNVFEASDVAQLVKCLPNINKSPELITSTQNKKYWVCWHMCIVLALEWYS